MTPNDANDETISVYGLRFALADLARSENCYVQ